MDFDAAAAQCKRARAASRRTRKSALPTAPRRPATEARVEPMDALEDALYALRVALDRARTRPTDAPKQKERATKLAASTLAAAHASGGGVYGAFKAYRHVPWIRASFDMSAARQTSVGIGAAVMRLAAPFHARRVSSTRGEVAALAALFSQSSLQDAKRLHRAVRGADRDGAGQGPPVVADAVHQPPPRAGDGAVDRRRRDVRVDDGVEGPQARKPARHARKA